MRKYRVNERLIALVGCYYDPIFMTDSKNMAAACMRFLFLYRSKKYGKIVGISIVCANMAKSWEFPLHARKLRTT
jgi:hypothetical protein